MKMRLIAVLYLFLAGGFANAANPSIYIDLTNPEVNAVFSYMDPSKNCGSIDFSVDHQLVTECITNRGYSNKGDQIDIYIRHYDDTVPLPVFDEEKRSSKLSSDLEVLIKVIDAVIGASGNAMVAPGEAKGITVSKFTHTLLNSRATLTVEVTTIGVEGESVLGQESAKVEVITGPKEHWFISADLLVTETDQLSYDSENGTLVERTKPSEFFVGFNYQFGDLISDENSGLEKMYLKLFVKASSRPLDSYGIGLGYAFNNLGSVFLSYNRFLEDADPMESSIPREEYGDAIGIGISMSINSALGWLGKQ